MIVLLKASGAYPNIINNDQVEQINHIFYAEQHSNKHSLAHTIMTVTELLRNDENMKLFYRYHRPFKQLIIQLYKKYGAKSLYIRTDPGISYALNHLMRVLYIKNTQMPNTNSLSSAATSSSNTAANGGGGSSSLANGQKQQSVKNLEKKSSSIVNYNLVIDSNNKNEQCPRTCSNPNCKNEETKYKPFKQCLNCDGAVAYCSSKCKKAHISYHLKNECNKNDETEMTNKQQQQPIAHTYNRIYSSTSTSNYQKNNAPSAAVPIVSNRRISENYQEQAVFDTAKRRESSAGQELFYQSITTKKMSKFSSMNENQRRNSVMSTMPTNNQELESDLNRINPATKNVYTKRSSMKESKSSGISSNPFRRFSVFDDISNTKLKQQQQQQTKAVVMNETTTSSVYFVRPLKTSTAVCLPDLTRRQSLRDIEKLKKKLNSIEATSNKLTTNNDQMITKMKKNNTNNKNSDSSSYNSCLSTSTDTTNSNKITSKKLKNNQDLVKKRVKKVDSIVMSSNLNSSVHKRRHSATDAILSSCLKDENSSDTKPKQQQQSIVYNDSSSLFYQGNKQQHQGTGGANQTKTSSSSKSTTTTTASTNAESITPDSSDPDDYDQQRPQVKVQRYAFNSVIDDAEEVETERRALINDQNNLGCCSNERIDSKVIHSSNNLQQKDNINNNDLFAYSTVINDDDQDLRSHCKVVKEFEKTLEFVKNASNLKVMPSLSLNQQNFDNNETNSSNKNKGPHISLASICYDNQMSKNNIELENSDENSDNENDESDSSDSDSDSDDNKSEEFKQPQTSSSSSNGVNLIINNSIDSHMITNNYSLRDRIQSNDVLASNNRNKKMTFNDIKLKSTGKNNRINKQTNEQEEEEDGEDEQEEEEEDDFIDDEFSLFNKNETLHNTYKTSDYKTFKKPLIYTANNESKSSSSLHSTRMPIYQTSAVRQPSFEIKNNNRNQIFVQKHELKVFDNLSVNSNQTNNNNNNDNKTKLPDLPKNSTPIFTDNATAASLNAKHRQFLNAKLNLTIMPGQQQKQQALINNNNKQQEVKSVFLVPQVPPIQQQQKVSPVTSANTAAAAASSATTTTTYKTSTLKSNSNLIMDTVDYDNEVVAKSRNKIAHKIMPSDILDVSKISALENATSTNSCVIVTKADLPKDIKKCLKEEIKKDKSKCSIQ
jgi:hypothetical protein